MAQRRGADGGQLRHQARSRRTRRGSRTNIRAPLDGTVSLQVAREIVNRYVVTIVDLDAFGPRRRSKRLYHPLAGDTSTCNWRPGNG